MKKVIILSCNTGQGHNSCAEAISEYFEKENISCDIVDSLAFISPAFSRFLSWGHSFMYRHIPGLFRWGYEFNERHRGMLSRGSLLYRILTIGAGRLGEYIRAGGYDTAICTHVFPAIALTRALKSSPIEGLATAYVATDYTCSPGTETSELQAYFVPGRALAGEFDRYIRSPHRTVPSGIPVKDDFWAEHGKVEARRELRINERGRHLLVMCGSMGCGPMVKLLRRIAGGLPADSEVTVICGTNRRLRRKLEREHEGDERVHIVGYTERVPLYMDSADLYLTKPGGISVTEAAAKRLPMAFINPVSGCEKYNMEFFVGMGAAIQDDDVESLAEKCAGLLRTGEELEGMRRALEEYGQPNGAMLVLRELGGGTGA